MVGPILRLQNIHDTRRAHAHYQLAAWCWPFDWQEHNGQVHIQERLVGGIAERERYRRLCPVCIGEIQLWGTRVQIERPETSVSPITSRITFSRHPSEDFHTPEESVGLWHLPAVGEDLDGHCFQVIQGNSTRAFFRKCASV